MAFPLIFRVDAGPQVGYGHLRRCLVLADEAARGGQVSSFLLGGPEKTAAALIYSAGHALSSADRTEPAVVVADIAHSQTAAAPAVAEEELTRLKRVHGRLVVIDSIGEQSLRHLLPDLPADILVAPYAGEAVDPSLAARQLTGPDYVVLDKIFRRSDRRARTGANRILITCGGSDPAEVSLLWLSSLAAANLRAIEIRLVVGPGFSSSHVEKLHGVAAGMEGAVTFLLAPDDMAAQMRWCDLALGTTGLTKYELAATGTPALVLSHDQFHAEANRPFAAFGSLRDLGCSSDARCPALSREISALLQDAPARQAMTDRGLQLVDGRGAARILRAIDEL
jgi:spore coat polysaccharide biosynthesis predicted glycosyltransferase SpsG